MERKKPSNYEQPIVHVMLVSDNDIVTASGGVNPYKTDAYDDGTWRPGTIIGGDM